MHKSFEKFCKVWKELAENETGKINEATLVFFLGKHFGISRMTVTHYRDLSLRFGFISLNKNSTYDVHSKAIEKALNSK